jgi:hypothetical protein
MKKTVIVVLAFVSICSIMGCKKLIMISQGVRKPAIESAETVRKYLNKKNVPVYHGSFIFKDSATFKKYISMAEHPEGLYYFYPDGRQIKIRDSGYCSGTASQFAVGLRTDTIYRIDTVLKLSDISELVRSIDGDPEIRPGECDFVILGMWAKFFGNFNNSVFDVLEEVNKRDDIKVKTYLINLDVQKSWDLKDKR